MYNTNLDELNYGDNKRLLPAEKTCGTLFSSLETICIHRHLSIYCRGFTVYEWNGNHVG